MKKLKVVALLGVAVVMLMRVPVSAGEESAKPQIMVVESVPMSIESNSRVIEFQVIEKEEDYIVVDMPERERDFKSYMDYRRLGKYRQKDLQDVATTDDVGFRVVDDRYIVAVGTAVSEEVGTYITLVLENGTEIKCIVGDIKDDKHTEDNRIVTEANQCVSEFVIDKDVMDKNILSKGSVSYAFDDWKSKVEYIKVESKNYFTE